MTSPTIGAIAKALALAQSKMEFAKKESDNTFFKSKYADLTSIIKEAKQPLSDNGLAISQVIEDNADLAKVTTILLHTSGEWISSTVALKPTATTPQAMGSAITYARRYGYAAIIGLSADDDDGNIASQTQKDTTSKSAVISDEEAWLNKTEEAENKHLSVEALCVTCGAGATAKEGISKTGKPYKGIFCSTGDKTHTKWL